MGTYYFWFACWGLLFDHLLVACWVDFVVGADLCSGYRFVVNGIALFKAFESAVGHACSRG